MVFREFSWDAKNFEVDFYSSGLVSHGAGLWWGNAEPAAISFWERLLVRLSKDLDISVLRYESHYTRNSRVNRFGSAHHFGLWD